MRQVGAKEEFACVTTGRLLCPIVSLPQQGVAIFADSVRTHFQIAVIMSAWFMATGAQWDLVQVFGWARMVATYSQSMSLLKAIERTFAGELCGVCRVVGEAKQQGKESTVPNGKLDTKMIFLLQPVPEFIAPAVEMAAWSPSDMQLLSASRAAPPTPPPRA